MTHWHVQRHSDDDDEFVTDAYIDVFIYAAEELDRMAESEHERVSAHGKQRDYEEAYKAFLRSEIYNGLSLNARNIYNQGTLPAEKRAPLYQDEPEQGPRWMIAAEHTLYEIANDGPVGFSIWTCEEAECAPVDEDAQLFAENVRSAAVILNSYPTGADDALTRLRALGVESAVLDAAMETHRARIKEAHGKMLKRLDEQQG